MVAKIRIYARPQSTKQDDQIFISILDNFAI